MDSKADCMEQGDLKMKRTSSPDQVELEENAKKMKVDEGTAVEVDNGNGEACDLEKNGEEAGEIADADKKEEEKVVEGSNSGEEASVPEGNAKNLEDEIRGAEGVDGDSKDAEKKVVEENTSTDKETCVA